MTVKTHEVLGSSYSTCMFQNRFQGVFNSFSFWHFSLFCYQLPRTQMIHKYRSQGMCCDAGLKGGNALLSRVSHVPVLKIQCLSVYSVPPHGTSVYTDYMYNWLFIQFCRSVDKRPRSFLYVIVLGVFLCFIL